MYIHEGVSFDRSGSLHGRPVSIPLFPVQEPQPMLAVDAHTRQAVQPVLCCRGVPACRRYPHLAVHPLRDFIPMQEQTCTVRVGVPAFDRFPAHKRTADCFCDFSHSVFV